MFYLCFLFTLCRSYLSLCLSALVAKEIPVNLPIYATLCMFLVQKKMLPQFERKHEEVGGYVCIEML